MAEISEIMSCCDVVYHRSESKSLSVYSLAHHYQERSTAQIQAEGAIADDRETRH
jgi:hypothetical protein